MRLRSFSWQNYVPVNCILELKLLSIATNSGDPYTVGRVMRGSEKDRQINKWKDVNFC